MYENTENIISLTNGVRLIQCNNPKTKNAITVEDFYKVMITLQEDSRNDDVVVTIFTGSGDYFTSGLYLDVTNTPDISFFEEALNTLITYPKLLIGVVNGPAVGFGVCGLPLLDIVYASDRATFSTPFLELGFPPDICASYTFPRTMGKSLAWEVLFLGRVLNAQEALQSHLVSTVVPHAELDALMKKLFTFGSLPIHLVKTFKKSINAPIEQQLLDTNKMELLGLIECFMSGGFDRASKKHKKKSKL